jgi:hypothetical protein
MPFLLHERGRRIETGSRQIAYDADWLGRIGRPWLASERQRLRAGKQAKPAKKALGRRRIWPGRWLWLNALPSPSGACSGGGRGCITHSRCSESLTTMPEGYAAKCEREGG